MKRWRGGERFVKTYRLWVISVKCDAPGGGLSVSEINSRFSKPSVWLPPKHAGVSLPPLSLCTCFTLTPPVGSAEVTSSNAPRCTGPAARRRVWIHCTADCPQKDGLFTGTKTHGERTVRSELLGIVGHAGEEVIACRGQRRSVCLSLLFVSTCWQFTQISGLLPQQLAHTEHVQAPAVCDIILLLLLEETASGRKPGLYLWNETVWSASAAPGGCTGKKLFVCTIY